MGLTRELLLRELNDVKDEFIAEAVPKRRFTGINRRRALVACLCLIIIVAFSVTYFETGKDDSLSKLPLITLPEYTAEGMGFEGLLYYDADEIQTGNPWRADLDSIVLPVYKNESYDPSGAGIPVGLTEDEIKTRLENKAKALDARILQTEIITGGSADTEPVVTGIRAETDKGELQAWADGKTVYLPSEEWSRLPEGYCFAITGTTKEESEEALQYLANLYRNFLGYAESKTITTGDYDINGIYNRRYYVYDGNGGPVDKIIHYTFNNAQFYPDTEGRLYSIVLNDASICAEWIGGYPWISPQEAEEKLLNGQYQTSVPYSVPGKDAVVKVEMVYRTGPSEETLLPYYRFYVELPKTEGDAWKSGLKMFGVYYVPAIQEEYISNYPVNIGYY